MGLENIFNVLIEMPAYIRFRFVFPVNILLILYEKWKVNSKLQEQNNDTENI